MYMENAQIIGASKPHKMTPQVGCLASLCALVISWIEKRYATVTAFAIIAAATPAMNADISMPEQYTAQGGT
jgi:hypothetical protein